MSNDITNNEHFENIYFTKEESLSLSKVRIIKKNLVHVHGFPQSLKNIQKLRGDEYFGQYGKIKRILLNQKTDPETNKTSFSVYITYSNEIEASYAILSVDSLLIEGKIIRAFFGTTKYCNYFLNNKPCPNIDNCHFLHKIFKDKDFIIDSDNPFYYDEHLNLAKKIIQNSNPEYFLDNSMTKIEKTFLPNEKEKDNSNNNKKENKILLNTENNSISKDLNNNYINNNGLIQNNMTSNIDSKFINNNIKDNKVNIIDSSITMEKYNTINLSNEPSNLYNLFKNTIEHILLVKPFFIKLENNIPLKEMEFNFFKNELKKNGIDIYTFLDGCLDSVNYI